MTSKEATNVMNVTNTGGAGMVTVTIEGQTERIDQLEQQLEKAKLLADE